MVLNLVCNRHLFTHMSVLLKITLSVRWLRKETITAHLQAYLETFFPLIFFLLKQTILNPFNPVKLA